MRTRHPLLLSLSLSFFAALGLQAQTPAIPATPIKPVSAAAPTSSGETLKPGAAAPDFTAKDLTGATVKLSDFKDKVVVVDFWATWCGPCLASLPHTQEVAKNYKEQGVVVFAACTSDSRANFETWMKKNQQNYPDVRFACDPNERGSASYEDRASKKLYGVKGIPTQFVVGRDGKIVETLVGYQKGDVRLEAALARAGLKVDPATQAKGEQQMKENE